jgi:hypothetical protein
MEDCMDPALCGPWPALVGQVVVLDLASPWVYLGRLAAVHADCLELEDADAHDLRDTATTREKYVRDSREHGLSPNRRRVWVSRRDVVAVAKWDDVLG